MADHGSLLFTAPGGAEVARMAVYVQGSAQAWPGAAAALEVVPSAQALADGEAPLQLLEGVRYEYEIDDRRLELALAHSDAQGVVVRSRLDARKHSGVLNPGLATGQLLLVVRDAAGAPVGSAAVEVRSRKLNYKADYRQMMEDITVRCVDLLQELRAPSVFKAIPDPGHDSATMGQRFAFVRALLQSRPFVDALHRITTHPHQRWEAEEAEIPVARGFKPSGKALRLLARGARRVAVPAGHPLRASVASLPEKVAVTRMALSEDTPENRFVKFALGTFRGFLGKMLARVDPAKDARLADEISALARQLDEALASDLLRRVSDPDFLPLGSPTLQRREGYREVLQAWLRFALAARLVWHGGEDVYGAGQRDVATLYEYWVFFCLLDIVAEVFELARPPSEDLLAPTADGFGLTLKAGTFKVLAGRSRQRERELEVRFSYNRSFRGHQTQSHQGSWTKVMRPDYTLSLWPAGFTEAEAEKQELMVHVHFDAKYRVDSVAELLGDDATGAPETGETGEVDAEALDREKADENRGTYKRADLLKMHAYRDAIRRTQGAYVLYPGDVNHPLQGYHEVLPGLGAFALRPGGGTESLKSFLLDVVSHVANRSSAREQHSFHTYQAFREAPKAEEPRALYKVFPETAHHSAERHTPPRETFVVVGWVKGEQHLKWIEQRGKYNFRMGSTPGALRLSAKVVGATYLLLHGQGDEAVPGLFRIRNPMEGPRVHSASELEATGYPAKPTQASYLVYDVEPAADFADYGWDYAALPGKPPGAALGHPFATTLHELLMVSKPQFL